MTEAQERNPGDLTDAEHRELVVTAQTLDSFADAPPRLRELMQSLVRHLHSFVRETRLTEEEWHKGIEFLAAAGHITTPSRQEFVLLSDVLGISMLTVACNAPEDADATEPTVFGPFFVADSPLIELGGDIAGGASGEPCWVTGTVRDTGGRPVAGARVEVWEADDQGMYDVQYTERHLAGRAHLFTDEHGRYRFWGLTPTPYPIPDDGPVGKLLTASSRSPMRAAHLHFMVTAEGMRRLVTHIFVSGDSHLTSDSVFGVKDSLIFDFVRHEPSTPTPDGRSTGGPWSSVTFDIALAPRR